MNARKMFGARFGKSRAQAMTEYIIIVSLVAVACIAVVTAFGKQVANLFRRSTNALNTGTVAAAETTDAGRFTGISESSGGGGAAAGGAAPAGS
ncbi:MAG: hypothetical protein HYZ53_22205 [Planctomycetes bacterium]|nr:hypothetical protein [Planctomycetota bacterium]